ncbi:hypothetical protein ACFL20_13590, partial [Spirochaetota bacterium]
MKKHKKCEICKNIPDYKLVEILHTAERLPEEVELLLIIGGIPLHGAPPQVRKCPLCSTYYTYIHDHDSEAGVGCGYTDEEITRLSDEEALKFLKGGLEACQESLEYWKEDYNRYGEKHAKEFILEHEEEEIK